jgi:hypothetical protein
VSGACSTGLLGVCSNGTLSCSGNTITCDPVQQPSAELCNTLDDDCDGSVDEGNPQGGGSCTIGGVGQCGAGTVTCTSGALVCVNDGITASPELCNGLDDDCDGLTDETPSGVGVACNCGGTTVCGGGAIACQGGTGSSPLFNVTIGSSETGLTTSIDLLQDASGNVIVIGEYYGVVDFGDGALAASNDPSAYVAKYNKSGQLQWSRSLKSMTNASYTQSPVAAALDSSGNVYVGANVASNGSAAAWIGKVSSAGVLGTSTFGTGQLWSIGMDASNRLLVAYAQDQAGAAGATFSLVRLDQNLAQTYFANVSMLATGGTLKLRPHFAFDSTGAAYMAGVNKGVNKIQSVAIPLNRVLIKLSSAGSVSFAQGSSTFPSIQYMAVDAANNLVAVGDFTSTLTIGGKSYASAGSRDVFVGKWTSAGTLLWLRAFGGAVADTTQGLIVDPYNRIQLVALVQGPVSYGGQMMTAVRGSAIITFNDQGKEIATRSMDGAGIAAEVLACDGQMTTLGGGFALEHLAPAPADCGAGACVNGQLCDNCGCYASDDARSVAACSCGLTSAACGAGACYGQEYCEGRACGMNGRCFPVTDPVSIAICQATPFDQACGATPTPRRVFVTSTTHDVHFGTSAGVDAYCQARADAAGLGGTFRTWMGFLGSSPFGRFNRSGGSYVLLDGTLVATSWTDLVDGTLLHPIDLTELGTPPPAGSLACGGPGVMTNVLSDGRAFGSFDCYFTALASTIPPAPVYGDASSTTTEWTDACSGACADVGPVYCFEE